MKITPCFFALLGCLAVSPILSAEPASRDAGAVSPFRIMPVGDSITRGTYLGRDKLPNPLGGGWRKLLQDRLRAAGVPFEFVGELDYWAYGTNGVVAPTFSPRHHGLAGFSNRGILEGGTVPTPDEILKAKGVKEIRVPGIVEALARNKPDVVLLMSGANGFNASERDLLIRTVCEHLNGRLLVASIPPQKAPRRGWEQAAAYNASLPALVARLQKEGHRVELVDMYGALTPDDLTPDGVHPNEKGLEKIAQTWFLALQRKVPGGDTAGCRPVVGRSNDAAAQAVEMARLALWSKFIGPEGLIHDYAGEIPTPEDCALGRPNAIGWWSPIENGPMFTGTYLAAYCERVKREGRPEDRERIRRLVKGLLLCASVSDVKGFIARGVGTDGKCHYPLGSQDQTHPWFYGLHAYAMSGIPDEAERKAVVDKMREVADSLEALGWKCPCDGAFKGQSRGDFKSFRNHGAVMYLFNLMAMHDVTGDPAWLDRYIKARDERSPKSGKARLEICAEGYPHDREEIKNIDQGQLWIYVSSQGALAYLAKREADGRAKSLYRAGLEINAKGASAVIGGYRNFDNADTKVFGHARWREGYPGWFEQKTQAEAEKMASTGDPAVLGKRKSYEVRYMRNPLAAAALIALAGYREGFQEAERAISHYDYSKINMAEMFFAECAYYALPACRSSD